MRVFLATASLQSYYGGPAFSVSGLAEALVGAGVQVGLWAADQSAPEAILCSDNYHLQRLTGAAVEALDAFGSPDLLHDNGIWLPYNHRLAVLTAKRGIPRVVSTRGMMEPLAFKHKHTKKRLAWWLYQRSDLKKAQLHIATGEAEATNLRRFGLGVPISTIPNGVHVPQARPRRPEIESPAVNLHHTRTALFLGRLYPLKGLPMLVDAWARVRPNGWSLRIAGPDEAGHRKRLERAVADAGLEKVISFTGTVEPHLKSSVFFDADLFVLPTYSENFGMAIAEALAHGLPVLTTTGAPWSILQKRDCGWWVQPTVAGIADGLRLATSSSPETLRYMGENGRILVLEEFGWNRIANLMLSTYEDMLREETYGHKKASLQSV